jgi:nucleotide-binding universal stress UspA family protein
MKMKKAKRILVGLKTVEHAIELTDVACRLGAHKATLMLVHVIELPDPTPLDAAVPDLDATAAKVLRTAGRVAKRSGMKVSARVLRAHDAGAALLDEAQEKKADLCVLGYHHGRTITEIVLGTTAQHLARKAPCHMVFLIPPRE